MGWWLAGVTIAVTLAGPVLISVVPQRVAAPVTGRPASRAGGRAAQPGGSSSRRCWSPRPIGGLIVLRNQGLTSGNSGLYTSAAPVLMAIPVAVVVLRCYPPLARELARIAGRSRGVVAFVGLARATRTPPGTVLPSFALVLVLAMVAFPDMISASVTRAQVAASWQQVGADAIIQAPPRGDPPGAAAPDRGDAGRCVHRHRRRSRGDAAGPGQAVSVVLVDPARYAAVVDQAPGARFPVAALSGTPRAVPRLPAVATPAAAQVVGTAPAKLSVGHPDHHDPGWPAGSAASPVSATDAVVVVPQGTRHQPASGRTSCWSPDRGWMRRG